MFSGQPFEAGEDKEDKAGEDKHEDISTFLPPLLVIVGAVVITLVMIVRKGKISL